MLNCLQNGVQWQPQSIQKHAFFSGKTVVLTGSLTTMSRDLAKQQLLQLGARVSASLSAKSDVLIAGDKSGSKRNKAEQLGVPIINEQQFLQLLQHD